MSAPTIRCKWAHLYGALLGALLIVACPALGEPADQSRILIHAVVLAVDPARSLVELHHEALETGAATDRICRLRHRSDARFLRPGTVIEAEAETSHQPWVIDTIHVRAQALVTTAPTPI